MKIHYSSKTDKSNIAENKAAKGAHWELEAKGAGIQAPGASPSAHTYSAVHQLSCIQIQMNVFYMQLP